MKCKSNKIGAYLDALYVPAGNHITIERAQYNSAVQVLGIAGFEIETVPCGKSVIHIVKSNTKE